MPSVHLSQIVYVEESVAVLAALVIVRALVADDPSVMRCPARMRRALVAVAADVAGKRLRARAFWAEAVVLAGRHHRIDLVVSPQPSQQKYLVSAHSGQTSSIGEFAGSKMLSQCLQNCQNASRCNGSRLDLLLVTVLGICHPFLLASLC